MPSINLDIGIWENLKVIKFQRELKGAAVISLLKLWTHAATQAWRDGVLRDYKSADIERVVRWKGKPGVLVPALLKHRLLEFVTVEDGTQHLAIHDWEEYQGHIARNRVAAKMASERRALRLITPPTGTAQTVEHQHGSGAQQLQSAITNRPINLSTNRSTDRSTNRPTNQPTNHASNHPIHHPIHLSPNQSERPVERPITVTPPRLG